MKILDSSVLKIKENGGTLKFYNLVLANFCQLIFSYSIGIVNSAMLSGYSKEAVVASGISVQILNFVMTAGTMINTGAVIKMSILLGKNSRAESGKLAGTAVVSNLIFSVMAGLFMIIFAKPILNIMNIEEYMLDMAVLYFRIIFAFLPVVFLSNCLNRLLICNGYSFSTLVIGIIVNLINVLFCYIVIFTDIPLPVTRVTAVALAGRFSILIDFLLKAFVYKIKNCPFKFTYDYSSMKDILKIGVPGGMNSVAYTLSQSVTAGFIASFGVLIYNTRVYVSNIVLFSYCVSASIGAVGSVFTGRYKGKEDYGKIEILFRQNIFVSVIANVSVAILIYLFHKPLIGIFTDDISIITLAGKIMLIDIFVEAFRAVNNVVDQALSATGDVKTVFLVAVTACWGCSVLGAYILGIKLGMGLGGVWIAFMLDECLKAVLYLLRWKSKKWKTL